MKNLLLIFIGLILVYCSERKNQDNDLVIKHLDKEIENRIAIINLNLEKTITENYTRFFDPINFDNKIRETLNLFDNAKISDSLIQKTNSLFNDINRYYYIDTCNFIILTKNSDYQTIIKINELTMLDKVINHRPFKLNRASYQAKFIPTVSNDSIYSGDVVFLKIDTLYGSEFIFYGTNECKDTCHLPIVNGIGKLGILKNKKILSINIDGAIICNKKHFKYHFKEK